MMLLKGLRGRSRKDWVGFEELEELPRNVHDAVVGR
jgi:hypothetical protein